VEGSVRKSGNKVRVTAQLIDASTGNHIWADRYDRDLKDVFLVQDEVVRIITSTLVGRVAYTHVDRTKRIPTSNQDAYDWFIQGRELFYNGSVDDNSKACMMFEKAVSLDTNYAAAYALLGETYLRDWLTFWNNPPELSLERAWESAKKALALNGMDSQTHTALGVVNLFVGDINQAQFHLNRALKLNHGDTHSLVYMSRYDIATGDLKRALERINEAHRNNPFGKYSFTLVPIYYSLHRYEEAIQVMLAVPNPAPIMLPWMAAVYSQSGDTGRAHSKLSEFITIATEKLNASSTPIPENWLRFIIDRWRLVHDDTREHFLDGLRKAGKLD
jgi:adenylate cyclase